MARTVEYHIPHYGTKRVLVVTEDRLLRSHLHKEFELARCEIVSQARLEADDSAPLASYDLILIDAAVFPEASRPESLRALHAASGGKRFVLLVGPQEHELVAEIGQIGIHMVRERPAGAEALADLVRDSLGERPVGTEAVPVAMDLAFLPEQSKSAGTRRARTGPPVEAVPVPMELRFLEKPTEIAGKRRVSSSLVAVGVHSLVLVAALLVPLLYTETLEIRQLTQTRLAAPPPPPPPPAPNRVAPVRRPKRVQRVQEAKVTLPRIIPKNIARVVSPPEPDMEDFFDGTGVPGGLPGGQLGGVIGGVLGGIPTAVPPPVEIDEPRGPVRVGGEVRPPQLLKYVEPIYSPLAQRARVQGTVRIDAIIDANGRVVEIKVLYGHPLLVSAAMHAVKQWIYEPTYLNGRPAPVVFEITVHFQLG